MELADFWKAALAAAGLAAVASFVLWSLYKHWLTLPIFSTLTKGQQYKLLRLFLILTFLFSIGALVTYAGLKKMDPSGEPKNESEAMTILPIDNPNSLIESFSPTSRSSVDSERVSLKFEAEKLNLRFPLAIPYDMLPHELLEQLIAHFSLKEHVVVDLKSFPTGLKGGFWYSDWKILLNGREVGNEYFKRDDSSFRQLGAKNGDSIGVKVQWGLGATVSKDGVDETAQARQEPSSFSL